MVHSFLPIPAIDLMDGQVVRLKRGEAGQKTVYSNDPVAVAKDFEAAGARRLHIVDLDGAFKGRPANLNVIEAIRNATSFEIELGGGLRTRETVQLVLKMGINDAILGTSAIRDRKLTEELAAEFGNRLIVGIDARDGMVAIEGWVETSTMSVLEFARELETIGIGTVIHTDIATDGMLTGPNAAALAKLADSTQMKVVASGGVSSIEDLEALRRLGKPNLIGAIIGRAIYDKRIDLREAIARMTGPSEATRS
ncbi:1-(5-phosphoribosyl)-5-[(5-phosphoribosylamino)methylideneamino]imidazole-4-carboxamide isomerase [bacterium]|nr:1-(5-phosphoribosyl)-5-[(5-phosphoribosylamino)methylideneamino]imidazole-4-carboxamide isomerase [bacterium]